jgi:hypothetical protein
MRMVAAWAGLLLLAGVARAQDRIPQDEARGYARALTDVAKKVDDAPIKLEADPEKPVGIRHDEHGLMVIPAKGLSAEALAKADKEVVPVGQLWLRKLTPVVADQPVADDKLRGLPVTIDGNEVRLSLCLLGAKKTAAGDWELLVYGKDKEPLARLPLKATDGAQDLPIELEGKRNDNGTGSLTIKVLGKHEATLVLGPQ